MPYTARMQYKKSVSIILPATDETYSLVETVEQARSNLSGHPLQFLIVTSPSLTTSACRTTIDSLQKKYRVEVESFDQTSPGIGRAIQEALSRARHDYVVLMASDLETDPSILPTLVDGLDQGTDIVATTRWKKGARFHGYHPVKLVFNFLFQLCFRLLYWTNLTDLTYAYRAYRTDLLKKIRWEEARFPFLFESIVKPLRLGYKAAEIEAPWTARKEGESHNSLRQTIDYARVGLRVRFMDRRKMLH